MKIGCGIIGSKLISISAGAVWSRRTIIFKSQTMGALKIAVGKYYHRPQALAKKEKSFLAIFVQKNDISVNLIWMLKYNTFRKAQQLSILKNRFVCLQNCNNSVFLSKSEHLSKTFYGPFYCQVRLAVTL